jgi:hypothetical protein
MAQEKITKLPNLPQEFWIPNILTQISDKIGIFMKIDEHALAMDSLTIANIYIKIVLNEVLIEGINLNYCGITHW